jgi:hypothetical protein
MLMGEALFYFDKLPLVEDAGILKNILCMGLWSAFDKKYKPSEKEQDNGSRSV